MTVLIKVFSKSICMLESYILINELTQNKISFDLLFKFQLLSKMAGAVNVNF